MADPAASGPSAPRLKALAAARTVSGLLLLVMFAVAIGYRGHVPIAVTVLTWVIGAAALLFLALWKQARGVGKVLDANYVAFLAFVVVVGALLLFF